MSKKKEFLTIKQAAEYLGVTAQTLRNWDKAEKLKPLRHPINNYRVYELNVLHSIILKIKELKK